MSNDFVFQDGTSLSLGVSIPVLGDDPSYCTEGDLAQRFGIDLIRNYANMTGSDTEDQIAARILWGCYAGSRDVDTALRGGHYKVPFVGPPFDWSIVDCAAYCTLIRLYELKGTIDFNAESGKPQHRYHFQKAAVAQQLLKIRSGTNRLDVAPTYKTSLGVRNDRVATGAIEGRHVELGMPHQQPEEHRFG